MKNNQLEHKLSSQLGKLILLVSFIAGVGLVSGCKGQGTGILGQQTTSTSDEDPLIKNAPFAFDYAADTISYNSCVIGGSSTQDASTLHGLKIGSNEGFADNLGTGAVRGGVKLRSDFLQYVGKNFSPDYPSDVVTPLQVMRVLNTSYSVQNSSAFLQFGVRRKSDYAIIPDLIAPPTAFQASNVRDAKVFTNTLSSGFLGYSITKSIVFNAAGNVLAEGPRVYDLADTQDSIPIEGAFNFNATIDETYAQPSPPAQTTEPFGGAEAYPQKVRDAFTTGTQILTATFGGTGPTTGTTADDIISDTINNIKRPYKSGTTEFDSTKAFGRGYQLKFESQTSLLTWPKNRLTKVTEIALDTGTPTGGTSWTCEQFPIAPPSLWNNTRTSNKDWVKDSTMVEPNCAPLLAEDTTCSAGDSVSICATKKERLEKIKRIRRHYSVDNWNVGLMFKARPKAGYLAPVAITTTNAACGTTPFANSCYTREFEISIDTTNPLCVYPATSPFPSSCFIVSVANELCVSPKTTNSCYLPTAGILQSGLTTPADATLDVGIQFDRTQDCYQTVATISGARDPERKRGRCAQFASVCTRTSSSY